MACLNCGTEHSRLIRIWFLRYLGTSYWSNTSWEYSYTFVVNHCLNNYHPINDKTTSWCSLFLCSFVNLFWQFLLSTDQFTFVQTCQERPVWAELCSGYTWEFVSTDVSLLSAITWHFPRVNLSFSLDQINFSLTYFLVCTRHIFQVVLAEEGMRQGYQMQVPETTSCGANQM